MKKIVVLTLVMVLLIVGVTPALAGSGTFSKGVKGQHDGGDQLKWSWSNAGDVFFTAVGTVSAVAVTADPVTGGATGTVTLTLIAGSHMVHDMLNQTDVALQTITLLVTPETRLLQACNDPLLVDCNSVPWTSLVVGLNVSAKGSATDTNGDLIMDTFTAEHITIGAALTGTIVPQPKYQNQTGKPADAGSGRP